jgi:hypothetical protein
MRLNTINDIKRCRELMDRVIEDIEQGRPSMIGCVRVIEALTRLMTGIADGRSK